MNIYFVEIEDFDPHLYVAANTRGQAWALSRRHLGEHGIAVDWTEKKTLLKVVPNFEEGAYPVGVQSQDTHDFLDFVLFWDTVMGKRIPRSNRQSTLGGAA